MTVQACIAYCVMVLAYHDKLQLPSFRKSDYSYGMYIYAFPLQQAIAQSGAVPRFSWFVVACFAVTLPLAMLSWHFVEKPSMRLRDLLRRRRAIPLAKVQG